MEIRENLELIEVNYNENQTKATMVFLDTERGEIREVNFNQQSYKDGKFTDDPEKKEKVEKWCKDIFGTTFAKLPSCIGQKKTVYCYDRFNSLFEVDQVAKFSDAMKGKLYQTTIEEVRLDDYAIRIRYKIEGNLYESKMTFGKYLENLHQWFVDPIKKEKTLAKFKEKYGVDISEADTLVGAKLIVEVKCAFGTNLWGDCKPLPN